MLLLKIFRSAIAVLIAVIAMGLTQSSTWAGSANGNTQHFGPFPSSSPDGGTCSPWAIDTFDRHFTVSANNDGTFNVTQEYKNGSFVTTGPASPGGCETSGRHGTVVVPGVTGTFQGYVKYTVSGGAYNPDGCSAGPTACTTTRSFFVNVFPGATISGGVFSFEYAAGGQGLQYHAWKDASDPTGANEYFLGDIANQ